MCLLPLLVHRPRRGNRSLGLLLGRRVRHLGVASCFAPGQHGGDPGAAAERGRLAIGLHLGDPERGAITREALFLRGLSGGALCEVWYFWFEGVRVSPGRRKLD
jgi:hypothetical protein